MQILSHSIYVKYHKSGEVNKVTGYFGDNAADRANKECAEMQERHDKALGKKFPKSYFVKVETVYC